MQESYDMKKETFGIQSSDKKHTLHIVSWKPDYEIKAAVQIVHGMVEFIERYDDFARYLCSQGIAVIGHDHLGHGETAGHDDDLGYFAREGGDEFLIEDMFLVTEEMKWMFPCVPYFVLGHSMGSFCLRKYMTMYGDQVDGVILMGTGQMPLPVIKAGKSMAAVMMATKGRRYRSKQLASIAFAGYLNKIPEPRTSMDWLTRDESIVDAYLSNKYNTFIFTVSAFHDFFQILEYDMKMTHWEKIPQDLAILIVSGDQDPVGGWGSGPKRLSQIYKKQGFTNVSLRLYEGYRHEILNELDRQTVYRELAGWVLKNAAKRRWND